MRFPIRVAGWRRRCSLPPDAPQSEFPARRRSDSQQSGLHVRHLSRRGQGQERIQAFAARLRSAIRLRSAALRSGRPPLQSRRSGPQPDARPSRRSRWRTAAGFASKSTRTTTRSSTTGSRRAFRSAIPRRTRVKSLEVEPKEIFMDKPGGTRDREDRRDVQRRRHARRHPGSEYR